MPLTRLWQWVVHPLRILLWGWSGATVLDSPLTTVQFALPTLSSHAMNCHTKFINIRGGTKKGVQALLIASDAYPKASRLKSQPALRRMDRKYSILRGPRVMD